MLIARFTARDPQRSSTPGRVRHLRQNPNLEVVSEQPLPESRVRRIAGHWHKRDCRSSGRCPTRAFRRITCGGCPKARRKARRIPSRSAKPVCRAMTSIGMEALLHHQPGGLDAQISRMPWPAWPGSARNARPNWRGLRRAASASCPTVSGASRLRFAYASTLWMRSDLGSSSSSDENCD